MDAASTTLSVYTGNVSDAMRASFMALVAYEDAACGKRAKATLERLAPKLSAQGPVNCQMWRFDVLQTAQARDESAAGAAKADLVLVAAHHSSRLPDAVKNWIWTWLPLRGARGGALALTFEDCIECEHSRGRPESPVCAALRRAAALGHMDFVCTRSNWQGNTEEAYLRRMMERAHKTSTTLEGILSRRGVPHWGLNE